MKSKSNLFLPLFAIVFTVGLAPLQAADIDTTGTTITLNTDAPGNKYLGDGTLQVSADANASIDLGTGGGSPQTYFYMTGGLITIDSGVKLVNGGWSKGTWINGTTPNMADMAVNGTLDLWDGNDVYVNALNGAGAINISTAYGDGVNLRVGVDGGGGIFSGTIATGTDARPLQIVKSGAGTQTFDNLANQKPKKFILNDGVVNLSVPEFDSATVASGISGPGNLTKSGLGMLTLSGTVTHTGVTTVSEGTLSMGDNLTSPNWVIASGAVLDLNFYGQKAVTSLEINSSGPLPPGLYDSSHSIYGSYFSGSGSLRILGDIPLNSGVWTSLTDGDWTIEGNWQGNTIASGAGNTATFNAAADVTVTLDAGVTMGHLAFDVSNYTISGSNILTLDATSPSITVVSGRTAEISSIIAGTAGLTKLDAGLLTLSGPNTYTGGTTVSAGQLRLVNNKTGSSTFIVNSDLEFNLTTGNQTLQGGSITGAGNLIKTGGSELYLGGQGGAQTIALTGAASLIDVQEGTLRNDWGNSAWGNNKAGLRIAGGANFNVHDGNATVDELDGSGTIGKWWGGASTLTIGVNNGSGTFAGTISNSSGILSLVKKGTGTQILTGSNTYSGTTTVNAGILSLGNSLAMQNSTLDTTNSIAGDATNGLQTTVTSLTLGGLTGNKDLAAVFTTASGGYDTVTSLTLNLGTGFYSSYSGVIAEGAAGMTLTKTGSGALSLTGTNTYPGATAVSAGVLGLQKSSTSSITVAANAGLGLVVGGAGGYTLADVDSLWTNSLSGVTMDPTSLVGIDTTLGDLIYSSSPVTTNGFAKTGLNTLTLNGNNTNAFGGGTTVYAGVLSLANTAAKPLGTVTVNAGAGLALGVSPTNEAGFFTTADVDSLWANTLSGVTLNATSLVGIDTTQGDLTYTTPASTRGFAKVGSNTLTLTGTNAYTGGTLVGSGRLKLVDTMTGSTNYITNGELEINLTTGNQQLQGGSFSGTGKLIKTGGSELTLGNWGGAPTVALKGADSVIDVQVGTLSHFQGAIGWGAPAINWAGNEAGLTVASGATFELRNNGATVDELNGGGTINKGTWDSPVTLTIGVKDGSGTFSGGITQSGTTLSLVKQGTGTQTLSGNNNYGGPTTVNAGTLKIGDGGTTGSLGGGAVTVAGTLIFNRSDNYGTGGGQVFSGTGTIIKNGAGNLIFNGGSDHTNVQGISNVVVNDGLIRTDYWGQWNSNLNLTVNGSGKFEMWNTSVSLANLSGNGTVLNSGYWGRSNILTVAAGSFSGAITDLGGDYRIDLVKSGTGSLTLSGVNTYSGTTIVDGGTLTLGANEVLPETAVSIGNATLDAATFIDTVGTLDVTAAATIHLGSSAALAFADSDAIDWVGGTLNITGSLGATSIRFGTDNTGLTQDQLNLISVNGSGTGTATLDANGYLVVGSGDPYAAWATGGQPFDGDANGDGVQDGLAWFLGAATPATNALDKLPKPSKNGAFLTLNFKRVNPYSPAKLFVEFGNNLSGWTEVEIPAAAGTITLPGDDVEVEVTGGAPDDVTVKIPTSYQSASGALFARLRATNN